MTTTRADRSASCVSTRRWSAFGLAQDGVQGRDDRHPQVAQQAEDVAAGRAAVDAVLVLEADDVGVREVQEVGRPEVAVQVLLVDLEPDLRRVVVPLGAVVDRHDEALGVRDTGRPPRRTCRG